MTGPLTGLKVIEIAGLGPTPSCGMMLGDMGADIIRVDRVVKADLALELPTRFNLRDRNKRSVAIDLKQRAGLAALLKLVERADVLIEGFRPGVAERMGFGPEVCLVRRPQLVFARATGWGQEGPLAQDAGHDINYVALTGVLDMIGPAGGDPVVPLNLLGDYAGGAAYLAFGIMCAVFEAQQSGQGQVVDGAIVDGVTGLLTMFHAMRQAGHLNARRGANLLDGGAPFYTTYRTKDGKSVAIGALEGRFYRTLVEKLGLNTAILANRNDRAQWPALRALFADIFARRTRDEWIQHFADCPDACFSPVLSLDEAGSHPHNRARGALVRFDDLDHPRPAPRLSRTPGGIYGAPPRIGEQTREILTGWGLDETAIQQGLESGAFLDTGSRRD
ncbi:CoA transferase [Sphingomonas sp. CL5.1]|uniref:CaiB/BaiF CoA transferase family protein n=1 Tax=Sphingomonas sp. CL5.1 TaxID=2653203 RepID=UPI001583C292|nr:CaiB/BaiF CoA-transferase family protein [Sphingomonas sp. CL5.1]QKS01118.1 CoA transferase [Sphingomonas sp. CL5.1]